MNPPQPSLFGDNEGRSGASANPDPVVLATEREVLELAREYFDLPTPDGAEPPLLKARRQILAEAGGAGRRGLVAKWADYDRAKGHISIHDPASGQWHDVPYKDAPTWAQWEARKRSDLWRSGDRRAFDLTALLMEDIWARERLSEEDAEEEEGIVEDHPLEEDYDI